MTRSTVKTIREKARDIRVCREADVVVVGGGPGGIGAALAVKAGVEARKVDTGALQDRLLNQGVLLPGVARAKVKV